MKDGRKGKSSQKEILICFSEKGVNVKKRHHPQKQSVEERIKNFKEVSSGLTEQDAV